MFIGTSLLFFPECQVHNNKGISMELLVWSKGHVCDTDQHPLSHVYMGP